MSDDVVKSKSALRAPPSSKEAERGVLGSVLLDSNRVMDICEEGRVVPETFYDHRNQLLYETLRGMSHNSQTIDTLTLCEQLRTLKKLDSAGGVAYIQSLIDQTPTAAHSEYYINIIRQKHLLRTIIQYAREAESSCYNEAVGADLLLGEIEQKFLSIADQQEGTALTWSQAVTNTISHIDRLFSLGAGAVSGLPCGLTNLDKKLKGLRDQEMIVLAARPSMGKTSLAMNIAECVALGRNIYGQPMKGDHNRPHGVGVFSLEMSTESLAMRMLCGMSGVPSFQIDQGILNPKNVNMKLSRGANDLKNAPIYVDDTGGLDVMDMRARARRMKKRYNIELIVIDYLQLCNYREFSKQGRQIETSQISGQIKSMAKELNLPVVVLSQLSRGPEQRGDKTNRPKLSDLRDSGAIEQDADVALLLRRPCKAASDPEFDDIRLAIIDVAKHRNGPTGEVRLDFDDELTRFGDRADTRSETSGFDNKE
ncbi:MAG: replicative DNA helicase [Kiritimatiellae bacterium]|jgi:replicative DNA helicase|nr:replicative DNA helicase [Kiritimatiellia bacterium]